MATERRRNPTQARGAERTYMAQLKRLADQVGRIIRDVNPQDPNDASKLSHLLQQYAIALDPWARRIATRMVNDVNMRDLATWRELGKELSAGLRREVLMAPRDSIIKNLVDLQVTLIKSIPNEAAQRVNKLALEAVEDGQRASSIVAEIMRSGKVAESRAKTIARTEISRTAAALSQDRAQSIGSTGYIWRTSRDGDVRPSHKAMAGKFVAWNQPPTLDNLTGHAGCLPNCRCWAEIVIPD
jgi:SPP1 gp7 family putative phage head morphogenesis protein